MIEKYDEIIQEQLKEGIVERVVEEPNERVFYIPHKPVKRETSTTTKLRIVFDASANKPSEESLSLNQCFETCPPLQNLLWNVLVQVRHRVKQSYAKQQLGVEKGETKMLGLPRGRT